MVTGSVVSIVKALCSDVNVMCVLRDSFPKLLSVSHVSYDDILIPLTIHMFMQHCKFCPHLFMIYVNEFNYNN